MGKDDVDCACYMADSPSTTEINCQHACQDSCVQSCVDINQPLDHCRLACSTTCSNICSKPEQANIAYEANKQQSQTYSKITQQIVPSKQWQSQEQLQQITIKSNQQKESQQKSLQSVYAQQLKSETRVGNKVDFRQQLSPPVYQEQRQQQTPSENLQPTRLEQLTPTMHFSQQTTMQTRVNLQQDPYKDLRTTAQPLGWTLQTGTAQSFAKQLNSVNEDSQMQNLAASNVRHEEVRRKFVLETGRSKFNSQALDNDISVNNEEQRITDIQQLYDELQIDDPEVLKQLKESIAALLPYTNNPKNDKIHIEVQRYPSSDDTQSTQQQQYIKSSNDQSVSELFTGNSQAISPSGVHLQNLSESPTKKCMLLIDETSVEAMSAKQQESSSQADLIKCNGQFTNSSDNPTEKILQAPEVLSSYSTQQLRITAASMTSTAVPNRNTVTTNFGLKNHEIPEKYSFKPNEITQEPQVYLVRMGHPTESSNILQPNQKKLQFVPSQQLSSISDRNVSKVSAEAAAHYRQLFPVAEFPENQSLTNIILLKNDTVTQQMVQTSNNSNQTSISYPNPVHYGTILRQNSENSAVQQCALNCIQSCTNKEELSQAVCQQSCSQQW